jgi:outer membrane protein OmpA-like peptidoglycan-associated protein
MTVSSERFLIVGDASYKTEITRLIDRISRTQTGRAIVAKILAHGWVMIVSTGDKSTVQGLTSKMIGLAKITFSPNSNSANTAVVNANVELKVATLRKFPGWGPDEVLFHEMVHAGRILGNDDGPLDQEEFFAILVTDIYVSEKGKPSNFLRSPTDHSAMAIPLKEPETEPYAFLSLKRNYELIEKYCRQHPNIAPMIADSAAPFNPIRDYYDTKLPKPTAPEAEISYQVTHQEQAIAVQMPSDVLFDFGKYNLKKVAEPALNQVATLIRSKPGWRISVEGHTDSIDTPAKNLALSRQRAEAVASWLVSHGFAKTDMETKGWGLTRPVAPNTSATGRAKNRRVEILLVPPP